MNRTQKCILVGAYWGICFGMSIGLMIASGFSEKFMSYALVLNLMAITPMFIDLILNGKMTRRYK